MSLSLITRKFTVEEYEKMTTQGIIKPDEKVELIRGAVTLSKIWRSYSLRSTKSD